MHTITNTFNVYSFKELSEEAKERAIESFRLATDFPYREEAINSIEEISKAMNCDAEYYSYDGICYSVEFTPKEYEDIETLQGKRAYAYIVNNYLMPNKSYKIYWKDKCIYTDGRKNWKRKSNLFYSWDDCPFTGYGMDYCFIEAWKNWEKNFNKYSTVGEFINLVADTLGKAWTEDNEYQLTDEFIIDMIEANDYEFFENGKQY